MHGCSTSPLHFCYKFGSSPAPLPPPPIFFACAPLRAKTLRTPLALFHPYIYIQYISRHNPPPLINLIFRCARVRYNAPSNILRVHPHPILFPDTTRPQSEGELNGVHYWFVSRSEFQREATESKFIEWGEYQKHLYGTSVAAVQSAMENDYVCVLTLRSQVGFLDVLVYLG